MTAQPRWLHSALLAACVALSTPGCGSETALDCDNDDPPVIPSAPDTALIRSQVTLATRVSYDVDGEPQSVGNLATASFVDYTRVRRVNRSVDDQKFSMTCSGLTGAPIDQCREPHTENCVRVQLHVDTIEVTGVPGGLSLEKRGTGKYVNEAAPEPLFGDEEIGVEVSVENAEEPAFVASYEQTLSPPPVLEVQEPKPGQAVGAHDLKVCWSGGGGGDVIEIAIGVKRADPGAAGEDTDKVVCLVEDDGCHTVPVSAFDWLRLGQLAPEDSYHLIIAREKTAIQVLDDQTATELKGSRTVEFLLPQE